MSSKSDFTEEEWARLKRAPFVAGMAISLADPGGPIEAYHETKATLNTVRAAEDGSRGELVSELAREVVGDTGHRENPLGGLQAHQRRERRRRDPRRARRGEPHRRPRRRRPRTPRRSASGC